MKRLLSVVLVLLFAGVSNAALTITSSQVTDWTAIAEGAVSQSGVIDISGSYATFVTIQSFLDGTDAHEGTEFRIQVSQNTTGNEDWADLSGATWLDLVGTANSEAITNNPLSAASTTITCADTTGFTVDGLAAAKWVAIKDGTLANSELVLQTGLTANTNITCLDGTTNEHAQNTVMWNIASSKTIIIPFGAGSRARVVINNNFDADGTAASMNYRVRKTVVTALN